MLAGATPDSGRLQRLLQDAIDLAVNAILFDTSRRTSSLSRHTRGTTVATRTTSIEPSAAAIFKSGELRRQVTVHT